MYVLTISYEYPPLGGGGSKVVEGLTKEFSRAGVQVDLVTMWYPGLPLKETIGKLTIIRVPCLRLSKSVCRIWEMPLYLVVALPILCFLCLRNKYQLNHTHFIFPDGVLALLLKRVFSIPYIVTAHGSDVPGFNPDRFKRAHKLLSSVWTAVVRSAEKIVCPSRSIENLIQAQGPGIQTVVIPNGLNTDKFSPDVSKVNRILVVTRMFERKGVQYLIEALEGLKHDYEIHLVGDGPYLPVLEGQVIEKNLDIRFWGFLDNLSPEIKELYQTSKIFVFPSTAENFPIVLLEAMASGLAIITTESTGCAEVVGDAAMLVKSKDSTAIRKCLGKLVSDPQLVNSMGVAARKRLVEKFSWKTVSQRYLSLYEELINNRQ